MQISQVDVIRRGTDLDPTRALARLHELRSDGGLSEPEVDVAQAAFLGSGTPSGRGRAMRAVAFATLSGWTGAPFIIEDRLAKSARGRASWSSLALQLQPQELKALMLGVSYEDDPSRWDDAIDKLERFSAEARRQAFDDDGLLSTRCGLLAQLRWFGLVGELLWLPERLDDWEYWRREDGWVVTQTAVDEWRSDRYRTNPFEGSEFTDLGDYLDAMGEDCWRAFDALIAEGDIAYLRSCGIQHSADGRLSFDL